MDVHKADVLEPLFQLDPGMDLVAGPLERPVDFRVVLLERGAVETAVWRNGVPTE